MKSASALIFLSIFASVSASNGGATSQQISELRSLIRAGNSLFGNMVLSNGTEVLVKHLGAIMKGRQTLVELFGQLKTENQKELFSLLSAARSLGVREVKESFVTFLHNEIPLNRVSFFMAAVKANEDGVVQNFLESGVGVDAEDSEGNTALLIAASAGNVILVQQLLDVCASINKKNKKGKTALICATENCCVNVVRLLLHSRADVNLYDRSGNTPVMLALYNQTILEMILGFNPNLELKNKNGETVLGKAKALFFSRNRKIIDMVLARRVEQLLADGKKQEALTLAVVELSSAMIRTCVSNGADVNAQDGQGNTVLMASVTGTDRFCLTSTMDHIECLLKLGARVDIPNKAGNTPLMAVAENFDQQRVRLFISKASPAIINIQNKKGVTALMKVAGALFGKRERVELFLNHGADPLLQDLDGKVALDYAFDNYKRPESILLLYKNTPGYDPNKALRNSLLMRGTEAAEFFLSCGAVMPDNLGSTLVSAARKGDKKMVIFLLAKGAPINSIDEREETALIAAAGCDSDKGSEVLELLKEHGADLDKRDSGGKTALQHAIREALSLNSQRQKNSLLGAYELGERMYFESRMQELKKRVDLLAVALTFADIDDVIEVAKLSGDEEMLDRLSHIFSNLCGEYLLSQFDDIK